MQWCGHKLIIEQIYSYIMVVYVCCFLFVVRGKIQVPLHSQSIQISMFVCTLGPKRQPTKVTLYIYC